MRILIGGTGSGCGKTTAAMLLMAVLRRRGLSVSPYKVGPDYIDPGFHSRVCGRPCHNLDAFLMRAHTIRRLLDNDADISVIEGVMGYYDGLDAAQMRGSTWEVARIARAPALLVVDASGGAASVAATALGFQSLRADSRLCGVLVNRVSSQRHYDRVREAVERYTSLPCVGYLTKQASLDLPSRHLGLVTARETSDLMTRIAVAADSAEATLDVDSILALAAQAGALETAAPRLPESRRGYRLGVAMDDAFQFYYQANLDALSAMGMDLVPFSPLNDTALPDGLDGLYIGGGYPELFAERLEANASMRTSIRAALEAGMRCYAECGGLMYLGEAIEDRCMVGFLPIRCRMTPRLQRFGYVTVADRSGIAFPAHEFHHALAEPCGPVSCAYEVRSASSPERHWRCGYEAGNTLAGFAHVHFADRPELIQRFWP